MRFLTPAVVAMLTVTTSVAAQPQTSRTTNPLAGDARAIERGMHIVSSDAVFDRYGIERIW